MQIERRGQAIWLGSAAMGKVTVLSAVVLDRVDARYAGADPHEEDWSVSRIDYQRVCCTATAIDSGGRGER